MGLTGGIASGKTTVARMFSKLGVSVIDADEIAREVVEKGTPAFEEILREFGMGILKEDGEIDRKKLGNIVFSSAEKRERLNKIVHPYVRERMLLKVRELSEKTEKIILDIPLLFETGAHEWLRPIILVYVPEEVQVKRLMERDGISYDEAMMRIRSQMPIEEKRRLADYVVDNSGSLEETEEQVKEIYFKIFGCN